MLQYDLLRQRLIDDLQSVGCPCNFELRIRDYSKTFYGCYRPQTNRVYLYYFEDEEKTKPFSYEHLLDKAVHEACHAQQWNDPDFVRVKGVMHDSEFYSLYNMYTNRLEERKRIVEKVSTISNQSMEWVRGRSVQPVQHSFSNTDIGAPARSSSGVLRVACKRRV